MNVFRNRYRRAKLAVRKAVGAAPRSTRSAPSTTVFPSRTRSRGSRRSSAPRWCSPDLLGYSAEEAAGSLGIRGSTVRSCRRGGARLRFEFTAVTAMAEGQLT
jgi:hypothetical protein